MLWFVKTTTNIPGHIIRIHSYTKTPGKPQILSGKPQTVSEKPQTVSGRPQIVSTFLEPCSTPPKINGNRSIDLRPCNLIECITRDNHNEEVTVKPCNPRFCNDTECFNVKCPRERNAFKRTNLHTKNVKTHNTNVNCTSVSSFAGKIEIFGGHWKPTKCLPKRHVSIIIPFRDRDEHLCILLKNLIPILIDQETEFRIFVVEQTGNTTFNKGRLMNAGFLEAEKLFDFNCVFFHDVDLIPENDRNLYYCGDQPRHLSVAIDEDGYKLMYSWLVGGVLGFRPHIFRKVNGYSNMFLGWGGEDDDMYHRMTHLKFRVIRPPAFVARYTMIRHKKRERWPKRMQVLNTWKTRIKTDGLRNVPYKLISVQIYTYYTKIRVDVGKEDDIKKKADVTYTKHGPSVHV
ncbi:beta-1,4-galactosyltransferase 4-like [Saccostrea echinata]|uniref:beta-1,4-galactosyltransferase 4-like n=1 Tax=Saccostrea echinata TaxID=191078 RepID=UPI002A7EF520|nr:beta-1,4-galactosyltransferase 4-like [Saccostrea echinata]